MRNLPRYLVIVAALFFANPLQISNAAGNNGTQTATPVTMEDLAGQWRETYVLRIKSGKITPIEISGSPPAEITTEAPTVPTPPTPPANPTAPKSADGTLTITDSANGINIVAPVRLIKGKRLSWTLADEQAFEDQITQLLQDAYQMPDGVVTVKKISYTPFRVKSPTILGKGTATLSGNIKGTEPNGNGDDTKRRHKFRAKIIIAFEPKDNGTGGGGTTTTTTIPSNTTTTTSVSSTSTTVSSLPTTTTTTAPPIRRRLQ